MHAILHDGEVVASDRGNEECCLLGRFATIDKVFYEVEQFPWFVADGFEEIEISGFVMRIEVAIAILVLLNAMTEEFEELIVPGHDSEVCGGQATIYARPE